jgi:hypothetical protein
VKILMSAHLPLTVLLMCRVSRATRQIGVRAQYDESARISLERHRRTGHPHGARWVKWLAERVGFEPTCRLPDKTLSRRPRYDHFGTSPFGAVVVQPTFNYSVRQRPAEASLRPFGFEKLLHQRPALGFADTGDDLDTVIVPGQLGAAHG